MTYKIIGHKQLISQCLSILPSEEFSCPILNYGNEKLTMETLMKIFIVAHIQQWNSYQEIETNLEAETSFQQSINLPSISGSQISRRINDLPTKYPQKLFSNVVKMLQDMTKDSKGVHENIGPLKIIDSTHIKLPPNLCDWAFVTKGWNVVKMHTRIKVVSEDVYYPEKMVPSTGNVSDYESAEALVESSCYTYLMDRGYPSSKNLISWIEKDIDFVVRISKVLTTYPLEKFEVAHPAIIKDEKVLFGRSKQPVRLVEFTDQDHKIYRLMTTRWDLTSEEIMNVYRYRWKIETFFRWIKQHLGVVKVWSTKPQGIWNQMYLALTAYCLALIQYLKTNPPNITLWDFVVKIKAFMFKTVKSFKDHLFRKKKRSKGRQKIPIPKERKIDFQDSIAMIKPQKRK